MTHLVRQTLLLWSLNYQKKPLALFWKDFGHGYTKFQYLNQYVGKICVERFENAHLKE